MQKNAYQALHIFLFYLPNTIHGCVFSTHGQAWYDSLKVVFEIVVKLILSTNSDLVTTYSGVLLHTWVRVFLYLVIFACSIWNDFFVFQGMNECHPYETVLTKISSQITIKYKENTNILFGLPMTITHPKSKPLHYSILNLRLLIIS